MATWRTIADRWLASKTVAGVHVRWVSAQECVYTLCVLRQEKQVLTVATKQADITNVEALTKHLDPKVPVYLTVEGKGVLVRKVAEETDSFLQDIIPDARPEDFYTTRHAHRLVSVVRRNVVDRVVTELAQRGFFVLAVHTGPFALNALVPFLSDEVTTLGITGQQLTVTDQRISSIASRAGEDEPEVRYAIGDERVAAHYLMAYATALTHFVPTEDHLPQTEVQQEFWHRQLFSRGLPVLLGFFLVVLLINTVVYVDAFRKNQALTEQASANAVVLQRLTSLQQEVANKEKFLATLGGESNRSKAALADRLAATVPGEIILTEVQISPLDEARYQKEKKKVFDSRIIRVSGRGDDMLVLNRWLSELEQEPWVDQLLHQQYTADTDRGGNTQYSGGRHSGNFSFTILLP